MNRGRTAMTGNEIYNRAVELIGAYVAGCGENEDIMLKRQAKVFINQILSDLTFDVQISNLSDEILCDKDVLQALPFGVAMLICVAAGITEKQGFFAGIYESRRARIKSCTAQRTDTLPRQVLS